MKTPIILWDNYKAKQTGGIISERQGGINTEPGNRGGHVATLFKVHFREQERANKLEKKRQKVVRPALNDNSS